ncbi:MAG TPA: cellulase family glycosylhydrolase [Polyangiaceae bacterium]
MRAAVLLALAGACVVGGGAACGSGGSAGAGDDGGGADGSSSSSSSSGASGSSSGASGSGSGGADAGQDGTGSGSGGSSGSGSGSGSGGGSGSSSGGDAGNPNLHVEGNQLFYQGKPTRLLGVDHSGTEYACIGGYAFYEGPDPDTMATAMLTWGHVNTVRVPLNEDCWLGINGSPAMYSGTAYQQAILDYTSKLHAHGLFTIVDLHWNAPGTQQSKGQQPMADADHAPAFWTSVATAFKNDPMTVFDLYNEPHIDTSNAQTPNGDAWACWKSGCTITTPDSPVTGSYQSAGMQDLVTAVRNAGATNVLMLGGLAWADDLSGWLTHAPTDPLDQMTASFHLYNFNACIDQSCWTMVIEPLAAMYPVVTGEMGENDCAHGFIDTYMPWADTHGVSYLGWTWNTWDCSMGPALITDYDGGATGFGAGLQAHLLVTSP